MSKEAERDLCLAVDGFTENETAVRDGIVFAQSVYPELKLKVFGSQSLKESLSTGRADLSRVEFFEASQRQSRQLSLRQAVKGGNKSALKAALHALERGEVQGVVSGAPVYQLCIMSRHILGEDVLSQEYFDLKRNSFMQSNRLRVHSALIAKIPAPGKDGKAAFVADVGASLSAAPSRLADAAYLASSLASEFSGIKNPRVALLGCGESIQMQKLAAFFETAENLVFVGFLSADRLFSGAADVFVSDAVSAVSALNAAAGVMDLFSLSRSAKLFSGLSRPSWLVDWRCSGRVLAGVNGLVIHADTAAGAESFAVSLVDAVRFVHAGAGQIGVRI